MLFIIDMQNDYVNKKGRYSIENADKIVPNIIKEIEKSERENEDIYYTLDMHDLKSNHRSSSDKEWGLALYQPLKKVLENHIAIKKDYHSISPEDAMFLKKIHEDNSDQKIKIVGVETNVCVLSNAIILRNSFPSTQIIVLKNMCLSSNQKLHQNTLDIMEKLKIDIQ